MRRGITLLELLVVTAVVSVLIALLLPAAASAREMAQAMAGTSNLRQIGVGLELYADAFQDELPQARWDTDSGELVRDLDGPCQENATGELVTTRSGTACGDNIGSLFAGTRGTLALGGFEFGISSVGADQRPLNPFVVDKPLTDPDQPLDVFRDPADAGMPKPPEFMTLFGNDTSSTYRLLGSSYTLNDHALDDDPQQDKVPTLVPREGGGSPRIVNPTRTWVIGSHPIYNYDDYVAPGTSRGQLWLFGRVAATLVFADGHAEMAVDVPEGIVDTTNEYTFLPDPRWRDRITQGSEDAGNDE